MKNKGIYKKMLAFATVPILLFGIAMTIFCYVRFRDTLYLETKINMSNAHMICSVIPVRSSCIWTAA